MIADINDPKDPQNWDSSQYDAKLASLANFYTEELQLLAKHGQKLKFSIFTGQEAEYCPAQLVAESLPADDYEFVPAIMEFLKGNEEAAKEKFIELCRVGLKNAAYSHAEQELN